MNIYAIGHSTRPIDEFISLLSANGVKRLCDIRTIAKSGHNPQFCGALLADSLKRANISYMHLYELGGLRKTVKNSINLGWKNLSFRGYADYMQTPEFHAALNDLMEIAVISPVAIMCAEAVPWRCHRSLVSDALTVEGWDVFHIINKSKPGKHRMTKFHKIDANGHVFYPSAELCPKNKLSIS